ncbi:MAG: hypothetical protein A2X31_02545 [Elusimicrobia bacterium GWB2_63_22]|nr:MAG: hypothetical protein A2X31_02545 [Elusimicrobia bacterium GWB2_63_22]
MTKNDNQARSDNPQAPAPQEQPQKRLPVPTGMIWTFWGAVAAAVIAARVWTAMAPQTPDRVIERWVMLAFAAFLAVFLAKLK